MKLGIIPARGGSKGIPRKNMEVVAGKPLIQWTIENAKMSGMLDHFLVSTEDQEIGEYANKLGVQWWKRPALLSADEASTLSVLMDVVVHYPEEITTVVVLQPTSPIRSTSLIDSCIKCFIDNKLDSIATGFINKQTEYGKYQHYRRQDHKGFFCDDGNVYVIKAELIKNNDRIGKRYGGMIISKIENYEIDDVLDLKIVEYLIKNPLQDNGVSELQGEPKREFILLSN